MKRCGVNAMKKERRKIKSFYIHKNKGFVKNFFYEKSCSKIAADDVNRKKMKKKKFVFLSKVTSINCLLVTSFSYRDVTYTPFSCSCSSFFIGRCVQRT